MKKLMMIALVVIGLIAAAPDSDARVYVNIGLGFPIGFYGYPAYYPYGYYPYGAPYYAPAYFSVGYRPYYWWHGRRIYYRHRNWR